jgi:hypothetical protein
MSVSAYEGCSSHSYLIFKHPEFSSSHQKFSRTFTISIKLFKGDLCCENVHPAWASSSSCHQRCYCCPPSYSWHHSKGQLNLWSCYSTRMQNLSFTCQSTMPHVMQEDSPAMKVRTCCIHCVLLGLQEFSSCNGSLSNAWEMSKNAAEQYCLFSKASFILCMIWCVYFIVEYLKAWSQTDDWVLICYFQPFRGAFLRVAFQKL